MELPSDFRLPPIEVSESSLAAHFRDWPVSGEALRNYHHEPEVDPDVRERAVASAVLVPLVVRPPGLTLLLTRRHHSISLPGHVCFPGGRADPGDADGTQTALRETSEEIGISPDDVSVLGTLGHYFSHSGHHIVAVVGLLRPPLDLKPHPREVAEILEMPARHVFRSDSYRLTRRSPDSPWALFHLEYEGTVVTGPTVCLLMNLYEQLARTHAQLLGENVARL